MTVRWIEDDPSPVRWLPEGMVQGTPFGFLGATPTLVKKWFPERTEAEWNGLDAADQDTLLKQAQTIEAKYNATISQYKAEGACDASKPGRLAGALRQMLINKGADAATLGPNADEFGISECSAWFTLFGASPSIDDAKQAIYATNLGFNSGTATYGWMHLTLANFCGSSVKLPTCGAPGGGPAPSGKCTNDHPDCGAAGFICVNGDCVPGCRNDGDCGPDYVCVNGQCAPKTNAASSTGGGALGVILLVGAAIGAIWFAIQAPAGAAGR